MQQQQPYQNPYEFITNPKQPKWAPVPKLATASKGMRIAIFSGFLVVLLILIGIVGSLLSHAGKGPNLTGIAQDQNEISRVATVPVESDSNSVQQEATKDFARTCALSVTSDQQLLLNYLTANGTKLSKTQLALTQNKTTDAQLQTAVANNTFDQIFLTVMQQDLNSYALDLKTAYAGAQSPTVQKLLSNAYQHEQLLVKQLKNAQTTLKTANS